MWPFLGLSDGEIRHLKMFLYHKMTGDYLQSIYNMFPLIEKDEIKSELLAIFIAVCEDLSDSFVNIVESLKGSDLPLSDSEIDALIEKNYLQKIKWIERVSNVETCYKGFMVPTNVMFTLNIEYFYPYTISRHPGE